MHYCHNWHWQIVNKFIIENGHKNSKRLSFFSLTLYTTLYSVGRGNLVLKHSVSRNSRSPFYAKLWRHCVLTREAQRRPFTRLKSEGMKMLTISFLQVGIEIITCNVYSHTLVSLRYERPPQHKFQQNNLTINHNYSKLTTYSTLLILIVRTYILIKKVCNYQQLCALPQLSIYC